MAPALDSSTLSDRTLLYTSQYPVMFTCGKAQVNKPKFLIMLSFAAELCRQRWRDSILF